MVVVEGANEHTRAPREALKMLEDAAAEIDRLRAENERLRLSVDILTKQCGEM